MRWEIRGRKKDGESIVNGEPEILLWFSDNHMTWYDVQPKYERIVAKHPELYVRVLSWEVTRNEWASVACY